MFFSSTRQLKFSIKPSQSDSCCVTRANSLLMFVQMTLNESQRIFGQTVTVLSDSSCFVSVVLVSCGSSGVSKPTYCLTISSALQAQSHCQFGRFRLPILANDLRFSFNPSKRFLRSCCSSEDWSCSSGMDLPAYPLLLSVIETISTMEGDFLFAVARSSFHERSSPTSFRFNLLVTHKNCY